MKFANPYKRLKEIKKKVYNLEIQQAEAKGRGDLKELKEIETEIMFLVFEQLPIEDTIKYFEKRVPSVLLSGLKAESKEDET